MSSTPSYFLAVCPNCLVNLRVDLSFHGRNVRCKHCGQKFRALLPAFPGTPNPEGFLKWPLELPPGTPDPDRLELTCPRCKISLSVRRIHAGHHVRCRGCQFKFLVPGEDSGETSSPGRGDVANVMDARDGGLPGSSSETWVDAVSAGTIAGGREPSRAELIELHEAYRRLLDAHDQEARGHREVAEELQTLRRALGGLESAEILRVRQERDSLAARVGLLTTEVQDLTRELASLRSEHRRLADELSRAQSEPPPPDVQRPTAPTESCESRPLDTGLSIVEQAGPRHSRDHVVGLLEQGRSQLEAGLHAALGLGVERLRQEIGSATVRADLDEVAAEVLRLKAEIHATVHSLPDLPSRLQAESPQAQAQIQVHRDQLGCVTASQLETPAQPPTPGPDD